MILIEDTRNQVGKHTRLNEDLAKLGVKVIRSKLYVGDYARIDNQTVCIDTKKDLLEVANNICGKQHERFRNELIRAKEGEIKLVILVEEYVNLENWESPRKRNGQKISQVKGSTLSKAIKTMEEKYGVRFIFCDKAETAKEIIKILEEL